MLRRMGPAGMLEYALVATLVVWASAGGVRSLHLRLNASLSHVTSAIASNVP